MVFDIDVLIICADVDNVAEKTEMGWASQFKKFLELMLTQVLGEKPNVMLKSEYDTITSPTLSNAGVLVTVLSKDFIQSGRCLDHTESFYKAIQTSAKNRNRVFKVLKSPLTLQ